MSGSLSPVITFVIVGHNEADTVSGVVRMAQAAAGPGDRVMVVDSASTDDTVPAAQAAGAEVLLAPIGKGAAMRVAAAAVDTEWICFLDADLLHAHRSIPTVLRAAVLEQGVAGTEAVAPTAVAGPVATLIGEFHEPESVLSNTLGIYTPLVAGLFPEVAGRLGSKPLTGFRAVRTDLMPRDLPDGYGAEAHINIVLAMAGGAARVVDIGRIRGKFKPHQSMGMEIADAVLDAGVRFGRLAVSARPAWVAWVHEVLGVIRGPVPKADRDTYLTRLSAAAARPLPSAGFG